MRERRELFLSSSTDLKTSMFNVKQVHRQTSGVYTKAAWNPAEMKALAIKMKIVRAVLHGQKESLRSALMF